MYERSECERARERAPARADETLPPEVRHDFEMHLEKCQRCQRYLREIRWTIDHLAALPREPVPAAMKERLLRALREPRPA